jgi:inorganic pyrophosphatase
LNEALPAPLPHAFVPTLGSVDRRRSQRGEEVVTISSKTPLPTFKPNAADLNDADLLVVVDTPKGSHQKYAFSDALGSFELRRILPLGMAFPYDFGFVPSTLADDGDPLDILLLLDDPSPIGCIVRTRPIGVIEARQRARGSAWTRNDRLVAVAVADKTRSDIRTLSDLSPGLLAGVEDFFRAYNALDDKTFETIGRGGPEDALGLVARGQQAFVASRAATRGT